MSSTKIKSISMGNVYAADFKSSFEFYNGILELDNFIPMGDMACYFKLSEGQGIYLCGGNKKTTYEYESERTTFTLDVESVFELHKKLKDHGVKIVQEVPLEMGENIFWFQCYDPSGNIVEFLGGE